MQAVYCLEGAGIAGSVASGRWPSVYADRALGPVDDNAQNEIGGALSYYYNRHNLKVQADWRQIEDESREPGDTNNQEFRLQTQFIF